MIIVVHTLHYYNEHQLWEGPPQDSGGTPVFQVHSVVTELGYVCALSFSGSAGRGKEERSWLQFPWRDFCQPEEGRMTGSCVGLILSLFLSL